MKPKATHKHSDYAVDALLNELQQADNRSGKSLWVADEHPLPSTLFPAIKNQSGLFLSNRFDQYQRAHQHGLDSHFSDFDFSGVEPQSIGTIYFRTAKERPVVHRVINEAKRVLPEAGIFWIAGYKNEGIKTHIQRAEEHFGCIAEISRHKNQLYLAKLIQGNGRTDLLSDCDYADLREIQSGEFSFYTKPGLYGWDKIDEASKLLMDWLVENGEDFSGKRVLDLGCGYGYLSIRAAALGIDGGPKEIVATDNCAAAIVACERNLAALNRASIQTSVIPSNAGAEVDGEFDVILCNPPFHQGFSTTGNLHENFVKQTKRLLSNDGTAWFVVNQFLNIESIAEDQRLSCQNLEKTKSFKIVRLTKTSL